MISEVTSDQIDDLVMLALKLWPEENADGMRDEFLRELQLLNYKFYLATRDQNPVGFIQISLRQDYVDGSSFSGPTGYVEGIYIEPEYRKQGIARKLVVAAELWAKGNGCSEMGADVEIGNIESQIFHTTMGFKESNRLVTYIKSL